VLTDWLGSALEVLFQTIVYMCRCCVCTKPWCMCTASSSMHVCFAPCMLARVLAAMQVLLRHLLAHGLHRKCVCASQGCD
jgi:hypothetical protein